MGIKVKEVELRCEIDSSDRLTVDTSDSGDIVFYASENTDTDVETLISINVKKHEARLFAEHILSLTEAA